MNAPMDIQAENELPEEKKENKNDKEDDIITEETFENINSPQLIQNILHLSTNSSKIGLDLENNIVKSLISINDLISPILIDNKDEENDIAINSSFNPFLHVLNKKNELHKINFEELNVKNKFLNQKIKQYNELKQKISDFKNDKNKENKELSEKEKMCQKLFLVQHPLINIFEDEINIKEIKNELHKEYLNKMENHTEYKYSEPRNLFGNILHDFLHFNDEENQEIDDQNDDEEDSNNENEDDEGSFVDEVYNDDIEEMEEIGNNNNNNNIGVIEVPIQVENIPQPNPNINIENAELPNQIENIQQQNENIHIENAELPNQIENIQQQNENIHIENAELPNQDGNIQQPNENNNFINDNNNNNNEDNNENNSNEEL
jgi:hypothetical protein